ncbi:hypothetical protein OV079_39010 [Nannocystis pusilla]|uniref:Uncharacterized protein n=1 Tax=Nannocystis pusilla TaxID=889268 RepID=A0A9X3EWG5_9BACT|nr:hypothetical protein [Nannocystis pusilla]MCY1011452.1 hypothetical protein [Nannocystis pusilla]
MARRAACLLAATVWLTGSGPAHAATVVLVHAPDARWRLAELRVRDELRALGMTVTDAAARGRDDGAMATLLAEHAAAAAVQLSRDDERAAITLWFVDPAATAPRRLEFAIGDGRQPGLVALRAAELIHTETRDRAEPLAAASTPAAPLVPLAPWAAPAPPDAPRSPSVPPSTSAAANPTSTSTNPITTTSDAATTTATSIAATTPSTSTHPTTATSAAPTSPAPLSNAANPTAATSASNSVPAPPPLTPLPRPSPALPEFADDLPPPITPAAPEKRHGLLVAANVGGGPGGAGVLTGLELTGWRELGPRLDFAGGLTGLVTPGWQTDLRGSILLGLVGGRAQLGLRWQPGSRTTLRLGLGGGLALGWALGRAISPYRSASDFQPIGMLSATFTLAVRLGPRLSAHCGAGIDVLLPPLSIRSGGVEAFAIGRPLLRGLLGLAWDWPLARR